MSSLLTLVRLWAIALVVVVLGTACSSSGVAADTAAVPPQSVETSTTDSETTFGQGDPVLESPPVPDTASEATVPSLSTSSALAELSARARFDRIVIDLHARSPLAPGIAVFHDAALGWCGSVLGATSISETDRVALAALTGDDCALLAEHGDDGATGLTDWDAIVDARWARVVWWEDRASFQAELEAMCVVTSPLDLRFDGFSVSAYDQYLSARSSGECRYFGQTSQGSLSPVEPVEAVTLSGSVFVTHENSIAVLDLEANEETSIVRLDGDVHDASLSPNGNLIALSSSDPDNDRFSHLWVLDMNTGECRHVAEQHGGFKQHQWSPQSDRFITGIWDSDEERERVEVVGVDGSMSLVAQGGDFSRIPDGAWIDDSRVVFGMNRPGSKVQWQIRDLTSGNAALVGLAVGSPKGSVAPDGSALVFANNDILQIVRDLDEIELDPWSSTELLAQDSVDAPAIVRSGPGVERGLRISPDGSRLLYASSAGLFTVTGAHVVRLDGADIARNLAPPKLLSAGETYQGVSIWSPDSAAAIVEISPDERISNRMSVAFTLDGQRIDLGTPGQAFAWTTDAPTVIEQGQCARPA